MPPLDNPKRERFCREYVIDGNATQAYIRAGYSANGADVSANRLLGIASVRARIAELRASIEKRSEVDADWVVAELVKIAKADIRNFYNEDGSLKAIKDLDEETAAALSGFEAEMVGGVRVSKIKRWDRPRALELLGKHFGMWPQKIEHKHDLQFLDGMTLDELRAARDFLRPFAGGGDEVPGGDRKTH